MNKLLRKNGWLMVAALGVGFSLSVAAQSPPVAPLGTLFNNAYTGADINPGTGLAWGNFSFANGASTSSEIGNQIIFNPGTLAAYITSFQFDYYGNFSGPVNAEVRFYMNNGASVHGISSPGTQIADLSVVGVLSPGPGNRTDQIFTVADGDFPDGSTPQPGETNPGTPGLWVGASTFTWSVQFSGMAAGDDVGLPLYFPPNVGNQPTDDWLNNNGTWQINESTSGLPLTFSARFEGYAVPEPSAVILSVIGGLGLFALVRRFRGR